MMAFMSGRYAWAIMLAALLAAPEARAQFYDLDGAYRCLTAPKSGCDERGAAVTPIPPPPVPPPPSLAEVIDEVRQGKVSAADMAILEAQAAAKEPHAVEVLGWCKLNGIGGPPDAIAAYRLYGTAAELGVPNARSNQLAIYATRLSPEQRQQMLVEESAK
jgi:TPR repeat protein